MTKLAYAHGQPLTKGKLRVAAEDFIVEEQLGFEPEGEGEHHFLLIEKNNLNTTDVARILARLAKLPNRAVSYSGLKDKRAITRQWFSVHIPGLDAPDWQQINSSQLTLLSHARHRRKLKRGVHRGNRFSITLRDCSELDELEQRIALVSRCGVPNYFGEQRFGRYGDNVEQAKRWLSGEKKASRELRSIFLSSLRASWFNQYLASRVESGSWDKTLADEIIILNGSNSVFAYNEEDDLSSRLLEGDIHPSGPLLGCDVDHTTLSSLEVRLAAEHQQWLKAMKPYRVKQQRRSLRVIPQALRMEIKPDASVTVEFELPRGSYATVIIRELVCYELA